MSFQITCRNLAWKTFVESKRRLKVGMISLQGGGFICIFYFHPIPGEMIQCDNIFQMG